MKKVELLAPAGNLEKLKYAIKYGADAVYLGVPDFSLRVRINQFNEKTLKEGIKYAHDRKKKVYVTLNIYAHNRHIPQIEKHLKILKRLNINGVIVSDPGIINLVKRHLPKTEIHLSTQANATNWQAVKFWKSIGVKRVIMAREVTLEEIKEIKKKVPGIELEYFVHGAMCMSYSGRCILSKWMTDRSANLGDCSQPCRWAYKIKDSHCHPEFISGSMGCRKRSRNEFGMTIMDNTEKYEMNIEEDKHGTYLFNSYDMNLIEHVKDLINAGVDSLKIEGRAKSVYYVSVVTRAYRKVIDAVGAKNFKKIVEEQKTELEKLTNRGYSKGFLLGTEPPHDFSDRNRTADFSFVGEVQGSKKDVNIVKVHNAIYLSDKLEAISPSGNFPVRLRSIKDKEGRETDEAHGGHGSHYHLEFDKLLEEGNLLRKLK